MPSRLAPLAAFATAVAVLVRGGHLGAWLRDDSSVPNRHPVPREAPRATPAVLVLGDQDITDLAATTAPAADDELPVATAFHHAKNHRLELYEHIPRRPDKPALYGAYRYPLPMTEGSVMSGYDLDLPDSAQRRGSRLYYVGHGGIDLAARRYAHVRLVPLLHQEGDAEILFSGHLFGTTVMTLHKVREGNLLRDYVVLYAHLAASAVTKKGQTIARDGLVGYAGSTGARLVHLHLEVRRVREGIDPHRISATSLIQNHVAIVCDPRNVLPPSSG